MILTLIAQVFKLTSNSEPETNLHLNSGCQARNPKP